MNPIAVIGIGCRFPKANNPEEFWQLLHQGIDAITEVPPSRWDPDSLAKNYSRWGGFLADIEKFDADFFHISPREAERIDPQHRLLLEVTWEALENAGIIPSQLAGSQTGVFVGISNSDYGRLSHGELSSLNAYSAVGTAFSLAANRISYFFDLKGPSLAIDTACSSSLVALHYAAQSLALKESHLCLVGGVNLILSPEVTAIFSQAQMMAADGRCKTFDAQADGYVRGEGCGVVVLKRLEDALKDGDNIYAVIRGSAINQDGLTNGITAPNGPSQQAVIRQALQNAGVEPSQISYVEAHGTGTSLGDPIEIKSLKNVLMQGRSPSQPCWVGSVKTNIGHLESAAGIASLIKVILCLQHQEIPPHLHLKTLNPYISLEGTPLEIPTQLQPWEVSPRLAGISSFGFGGTNCHVVLQEATGQVTAFQHSSTSERPWQLLNLSTKTEPALKELAHKYQVYLETHPDISLGDICFSANITRARFDHCLSVVTQSKRQLLGQLQDFISGREALGLVQGQARQPKKAKIVFLFPGQGSQYERMGRQLYHTSSLFREILDRCADILADHLEKPLLEVIFEQEALLQQTAYTQPALFALEYALAQLWQSWGIKPSALMGHSVGEYVAACVAGVFSLEDGLKLMARRGALMQALPEAGTMISVLAPEGQIRQAIAPLENELAMAAINGPESVVLSGRKEALAVLSGQLESQGIKIKPLQVSQGFHSPLMQPMVAEFARVAAAITYRTPSIPLISNLTGQIAGEEIANPEYWCRHILEPVRFGQGMETLAKQGYQIFLEIGPKPTLLGMGRRCLPELEGLWLPSLREAREDWEQMLESLSWLYIKGFNIDWQKVFSDKQYQKINLPTYPHQRQPYWLPAQSLKLGGKKEDEPRLFKSSQNYFYEIQWQPKLIEPKEIDPVRGFWLVFADTRGKAKQLAQELQKDGHQCIFIYPSLKAKILCQQDRYTYFLNPKIPEQFQELLQQTLENEQESLKGIIHLWNLDAIADHELTAKLLQEALIIGCASVVHLIQSIAQQVKGKIGRLWIVTQGGVAVNRSLVSVAQSAVWGLGKVIALEYPQLWGGLLDLETGEATAQILPLINKILANQEENLIAIRKGQTYVARLITSSYEARSVASLDYHATYLITGGLGGLGLQIAAWMVQRGARYLVLLGRNAPTASAQKSLRRLEKLGATIRVIQADVAQLDSLASAFQGMEDLPPLKGIIHGAGIIDDGILQEQTWERFESVLAAKVWGTWNLHLLSQDIPLDFFVLFSSIAALIGSPGQSNYAAANGFMDAFAHYRHLRGLPALSIAWGPWQGDGMVSSTQDKQLKLWLGQGLHLMSPEQGLTLLGNLLQCDRPHIGAMLIERTEMKRVQPFALKIPLLLDLIQDPARLNGKILVDSGQQIQLSEQIKQLLPKQYRNFLLSYLKRQLAQVLGSNAMDIEDIDKPLTDLGIDSLMAIEIRNYWLKELSLEIPLDKLLGGESLSQLADWMEERILLSCLDIPPANHELPILADEDMEEIIL